MNFDLAKWDDPRVQLVYGILTDGALPPKDEHWEGWVARRIVAALMARDEHGVEEIT